MAFQNLWREHPLEFMSKIPRNNIDKGLKFRKQVDYIRQKTDRKMNALKVVCAFSGVNATVLKNIYTATVHSTMEYGAVTFGLMTQNIMDKLQASKIKVCDVSLVHREERARQ